MNSLFLRMLATITLIFSSLTAMQTQQPIPEAAAPITVQPQSGAITPATAASITAQPQVVTQPAAQTLPTPSAEELADRISRLEERATKLSERIKSHGTLIYQKLPQQIQQTKQQIQQFLQQQIQPFIQQQIQQLQQKMQQDFQQLLQLLTQKFPALAPAAKRFLSQAQSTIVQKYRSLKAKGTPQGVQPAAPAPSPTTVPKAIPLPVVTTNPATPASPITTQAQ